MKEKRYQNVTALLGVKIKTKSECEKDLGEERLEKFFQNAKSQFLKQVSSLPKTQSK